MKDGGLLLAVDTCGARGSTALGRLNGDDVEVLAQIEVAGGEFASSLMMAIDEILKAQDVAVMGLAGIVAVMGPGSFTGIRIGLATVKGIAEAAGAPVVTVSRLALLASAAKTRCAVLDAHRGQIFCGIYEENHGGEEMLLTAGEVNARGGLPRPVGVCEESVAQLLETLLGVGDGDDETAVAEVNAGIVRVAAPGAADALRFSVGKWMAGEFAEVETLDGHYLRGADAKVSARSS